MSDAARAWDLNASSVISKLLAPMLQYRSTFVPKQRPRIIILSAVMVDGAADFDSVRELNRVLCNYVQTSAEDVLFFPRPNTGLSTEHAAKQTAGLVSATILLRWLESASARAKVLFDGSTSAAALVDSVTQNRVSCQALQTA
jgi:hypothetical protein